MSLPWALCRPCLAVQQTGVVGFRGGLLQAGRSELDDPRPDLALRISGVPNPALGTSKASRSGNAGMLTNIRVGIQKKHALRSRTFLRNPPSLATYPIAPAPGRSSSNNSSGRHARSYTRRG